MRLKITSTVEDITTKIRETLPFAIEIIIEGNEIQVMKWDGKKGIELTDTEKTDLNTALSSFNIKK